MEPIMADMDYGSPVSAASPVHDAVRSIENRFMSSSITKTSFESKKNGMKSFIISNDDSLGTFARIDEDQNNSNWTEDADTDTDRTNENLQEDVKGTNEILQEDTDTVNTFNIIEDPSRSTIVLETFGSTDSDCSPVEAQNKMSKADVPVKKIRPSSVGHRTLNRSNSLQIFDKSTPFQFKARPMPPFADIHNRNILSQSGTAKPTKSQEFRFQSDDRVIKRREYDALTALKISQLEGEKTRDGLEKTQALNRKIKELRSKTIEEGGMAFKAAPFPHKNSSAGTNLHLPVHPSATKRTKSSILHTITPQKMKTEKAAKK